MPPARAFGGPPGHEGRAPAPHAGFRMFPRRAGERGARGIERSMKWLLLPLPFLASAFFSATETAFFALRRVDFMKWKKEENRVGGGVGEMVETPGRLIATIFIGNQPGNVPTPSR